MIAGPRVNQSRTRIATSATAAAPNTNQTPIFTRSMSGPPFSNTKSGTVGGFAIRASRRAPSIQPVKATVGIITARTRSSGLQRSYQALVRSQKCRPMTACSHTTTSRNDWLKARPGQSRLNSRP